MEKSLAVEAINYKNAYINPVIRIAVSTHGMLFLCNRPQSCILDKFKVDIPMECYLRYGETLAEGANRLLSNAFPKASDLKPTFTISYHFENAQTNRLIYLFIVDMEDDSILCDPRFKGGKLWTFQQIEHNLGTHFFSECFELEYEHLKQVIGIRENTRYLSQVGHFSLPLFDGLGADVLTLTSDIRCNAKTCLRTAVMQNILHHLIIPVGRFYKQLCLMFGIYPLFKSFELLARSAGSIGRYP